MASMVQAQEGVRARQVLIDIGMESDAGPPEEFAMGSWHSDKSLNVISTKGAIAVILKLRSWEVPVASYVSTMGTSC